MKIIHTLSRYIKMFSLRIYEGFITPRFCRKMFYYPKSRDKLHMYWSKPWDGANMPQGYLKGKERSQLLVKIIKKYAKQNSKIIEIGCNVGRNLNYLFLAGFKNLNGIEISEEAVKLLKESYPEMYGEVKIYNTAVENVIKKFDDESFNVVFSMAVLEHIHVNSEWIFSEMVRATKDLLVTIEDERGISWGRFPRNYKKIFESLGMKQIEEIRCEKIEGLGADFFARVFKKHI